MPDNRGVTRRVHVDSLQPGIVDLPEDQAHHLRDVLRLKAGDLVELFDSSRTASAKIVQCDASTLSVEVIDIADIAVATQITVASAIPKGDRADWMIEKLSELGVSRFIPLRTERSVVHPEGKGKLDRWERLAIESAKQSRRGGIMRIVPLQTLDGALASLEDSATRICLSTSADAAPMMNSMDRALRKVQLFIGPEGGWSPAELERMKTAGLTFASLTTTILRIETAAVAASAVVATYFAQGPASR